MRWSTLAVVLIVTAVLVCSLMWLRPWSHPGAEGWLQAVGANVLSDVVFLALAWLLGRYAWPPAVRVFRSAPQRWGRIRHALILLVAALRGAPPPGMQREHGRLTADLYKAPGKPGDTVAGPGPGDTYLVWVGAGEFTMGADDGEDSEKPAHRVLCDRGFWIAQHLVTNGQYAAFLNGLLEEGDAALSDQSVLSSPESEIEFVGDRYRAKQGREEHPAVGVDWFGAMAYAERYGMDLPFEWEWEYAARGSDGRVYPWGSEWDRAKCCNRDNQGEAWNSGGPGAHTTRTMPVGSFPEWPSPCGALDMAGNLMEWCKSWYAPYARPRRTPRRPKEPKTGELRVVRGGNYHYGADRCRATNRRHSTHPVNARNSVGFRCVYRPTERRNTARKAGEA